MEILIVQLATCMRVCVITNGISKHQQRPIKFFSRQVRACACKCVSKTSAEKTRVTPAAFTTTTMAHREKAKLVKPPVAPPVLRESELASCLLCSYAVVSGQIYESRAAAAPLS